MDQSIPHSFTPEQGDGKARTARDPRPPGPEDNTARKARDTRPPGQSDNAAAASTQSSDLTAALAHAIDKKPALRFLARGFDVLLFAVLYEAVLLYVWPQLQWGGMLLALLPGFLLYLVLDIACMAIWATTPGKYLFNIEVISGRTHKLNLRQCGKRSLAAAWQGMAMGLPGISLFTLYAARKQLLAEGQTAWDRQGNFYVLHGKIGLFRSIIVIACSVLLLLAGVFIKLLGQDRNPGALAVIRSSEPQTPPEAAPPVLTGRPPGTGTGLPPVLGQGPEAYESTQSHREPQAVDLPSRSNRAVAIAPAVTEKALASLPPERAPAVRHTNAAGGTAGALAGSAQQRAHRKHRAHLTARPRPVPAHSRHHVPATAPGTPGAQGAVTVARSSATGTVARKAVTSPARPAARSAGEVTDAQDRPAAQAAVQDRPATQSSAQDRPAAQTAVQDRPAAQSSVEDLSAAQAATQDRPAAHTATHGITRQPEQETQVADQQVADQDTQTAAWQPITTAEALGGPDTQADTADGTARSAIVTPDLPAAASETGGATGLTEDDLTARQHPAAMRSATAAGENDAAAGKRPALTDGPLPTDAEQPGQTQAGAVTSAQGLAGSPSVTP